MATEVSYSERNSSPYQSIGVIFVTFPDGSRIQGTAAIVGSNDILTSGHVVYNPDSGGWAQDIEFYFGADYNNLTNTFQDEGYYYSPGRWDVLAWPELTFTDSSHTTMTQAETAYDIALIGVDTAIGPILGQLTMAPDYNGSYLAEAVGYSGSGMMREYIEIYKNNDVEIYQSSYSVLGPGSSGGPLLVNDLVVGVKSTSQWWADVGTVWNFLLAEMTSNNYLYSDGNNQEDPPPVIIPELIEEPPGDVFAPSIISISPAEWSPGVSIHSEVVIIFDEQIERGFGTITIKSATGTTLATYSSHDTTIVHITDNTLSFTPDFSLQYNSGYLVEFSYGTVVDLAGNAFHGYTGYGFYTSAPPVNSPVSGTVEIQGIPHVGEILTARADLQDNNGTGPFEYRWLADGIIINDATSNSYTLTPDDAGKRISVMVSFTDKDGFHELVYSEPSPAISAATVTLFPVEPIVYALAGNTTYQYQDDYSGTLIFNTDISGNHQVNAGNAFVVNSFLFDFNQIESYNIEDNEVFIQTPLMMATLLGVDQIQFDDLYVAFDTHSGGNTYNAYTLLQAGFGYAPDLPTLSSWVAVANHCGTIVELASRMIDDYTSGQQIATDELISLLYTNVTGNTPTPEQIDYYSALVGPQGDFPTQADLLVYAASQLEADQIELSGTMTLLDPMFF